MTVREVIERAYEGETTLTFNELHTSLSSIANCPIRALKGIVMAKEQGVIGFEFPEKICSFGGECDVICNLLPSLIEGEVFGEWKVVSFEGRINFEEHYTCEHIETGEVVIMNEIKIRLL